MARPNRKQIAQRLAALTDDELARLDELLTEVEDDDDPDEIEVPEPEPDDDPEVPPLPGDPDDDPDDDDEPEQRPGLSGFAAWYFGDQASA